MCGSLQNLELSGAGLSGKPRAYATLHQGMIVALVHLRLAERNHPLARALQLLFGYPDPKNRGRGDVIQDEVTEEQSMSKAPMFGTGFPKHSV